jgi:hypothetical protein
MMGRRNEIDNHKKEIVRLLCQFHSSGFEKRPPSREGKVSQLTQLLGGIFLVFAALDLCLLDALVRAFLLF